WPQTAALGTNSSRASQGDEQQLVLLVRGELLRRYPNALVYATKAKLAADGSRVLDEDVPEQHPIFAGRLPPDVAFFGFDLSVEAARGGVAETAGDQGWFFVLQEQPTEPRFGLDLTGTPDPPPPASWRDLAWEHLGAGVSIVDLDADLPDTSHVVDPGGPGAGWHGDGGLRPAGAHASDIAYITLQSPVRVAVHASRMLRPGGPA